MDDHSRSESFFLLEQPLIQRATVLFIRRPEVKDFLVLVMRRQELEEEQVKSS